ncbi:MAG: HD domain-containing protein [Chloroflexi bacterium]|nr:HD domain-containing protein [Chloroflexota bacterium]
MDADGLLTRLGGFFAARDDNYVWVVGGAVRDAIRGREIHDIDLVVRGDAEPIGRAVADFLGGTPVVVDAWNITRVALPPEVDGGRPFIIDINGHHGSLEDNLGARDFTVDAMAFPLRCWDTDERFDSIVDPLDGKGDLVRGVLRATSDEVFQEDPGRMLRGVRLASRLGFRMEPNTARAIRRDAHLLDRVSAERVRDEFMAILEANGARVQLEGLDRLDLLCRVIPELEATRDCDQPRAHHYWDVWGHLLHCVEYAEEVTAGHRNNAIYTMAPWTANEDAHFAEMVGDGHNRRTVLKLAALLHDIAKPQTKGPDQNGRIRFLGHSEQGAEMVQSRLPALRMARRTTDLVSTMVLHHLRPSQLRERDSMPSARAIYRYYRDVGDAAVDTLYLAMADFLAARGPELSPERWNNYARMIATVLEAGATPPAREEGPRALVNGHDLMDTLKLPPGPRIGALLDRLREAQAVGEISSREEALSLAARLLEDNASEV